MLADQEILRPMTATPLHLQLSDDDFLTFDGPTGVIVAPDDTRENFYHHLGLRQDAYRHNLIYRAMRREAEEGVARLFADRRCLRPELLDNDEIVAPFNVSQISELAFQEEVQAILKKAGWMTRSWYGMMDTGDGKNWVIRWMLWRVLRKKEASCGIKTEPTERSSSIETEYSCTLTSGSTAAEYSSVPSSGSLRAASTSPLLTSPQRVEKPRPTWYFEVEDDDDVKGTIPQAQLPFKDRELPKLSNPRRRKRSPSVDIYPDVLVKKMIKPDPDAADGASPTRGFWHHVMDTEEGTGKI